MAYELTGTVKQIGELQTFDSGFTKQEFVVTTEEDTKYPQDIKLEFVKDKCSLLDSISVGDSVEVSFDLRGNEYNEKFYVNLNAWKINCLEKGAAVGSSEPTEPSPDSNPKDPEDTIPF